MRHASKHRRRVFSALMLSTRRLHAPPIWEGAISFVLLNVPVAAYPTSQSAGREIQGVEIPTVKPDGTGPMPSDSFDTEAKRAADSGKRQV